MKKIKKRILRALAALLREELLEHIGHKYTVPYTVIKEVPLDIATYEYVIPLNTNPFEYNEMLDMAKEKFAKEVINHIHVDTRELISGNVYGQRNVRLTLMVQRKQ